MIKTVFFSKRTAILIILIAIALISFFGISKIATTPSTYAKTIEALDAKKLTVTELAATGAATSVGIAMIPSEATTPIANQVANVASYLTIIVCVIFLEKCLLTITGFLTFKILIPIACVLFAIYLFVKKEFLRSIAIKLIVFGVAAVSIVPISVQVSNLIDETIQLEQTIDEVKQGETEIADAAENLPEEQTGFVGFVSNIAESFKNGVSAAIKKAEDIMNNFIDAVAALIITACAIPVLVLFFFVWLVKIIFGIKIEIPKKKLEIKPFKNKTEEGHPQEV